MVQQPRAGWSTDDSQLWLSTLVRAMEEASRPECRALPCAWSALAELRAQLARQVPFSAQGRSAFSRCN